MSSLKRIFGNAFYYGVIPKIPQVINVLLMPFITPFLTLDDYGIWGIVSSYSAFFLAIAPLGLHVHLPNYYFEVRKWKIYWNHIFYLFLVSGVIASALYICFMLAELSYVSVYKRLLIGVASCFPILLFGTSSISSQLYPLLEKPLPLVLRNVVASLSAIAVSSIVIIFLRLGYWGWILGSSTSAIVSFILFYHTLYKNEGIYPQQERNLSRIKRWLKISAPVIPHTVGFMLLNSSSRIIMTFYEIPLADIGIFSNGYFMGDYITVVSIALVTALSPQMQLSYREKRWEDMRHIYYLSQLVALICVFLVSMWMPEIYKIIMRNESLHSAAPVASMICYANVLMPFYQFLSLPVFINKNTVQLLWLVFLPGVLNVVLCLVFLPIYGYWAAVISTLISFWSLLLVPLISKYHKAQIKVWLGNKIKIAAIFLILLSSLLLSNLLAGIDWLYKLPVTVILMAGFYLLIRLKPQLKRF